MTHFSTLAASCQIRRLAVLASALAFLCGFSSPLAQEDVLQPKHDDSTGKTISASDEHASSSPASTTSPSDSTLKEEVVVLARVRCFESMDSRYTYLSYVDSADSSGSRKLLVFRLAIVGDIMCTRSRCIKRYSKFGKPARVIPFIKAPFLEAGGGSYLAIVPDPDGALWSASVVDPKLSGVELTEVLGIVGVDWDSSGLITGIHVGRPIVEDEYVMRYVACLLTQGSVRCYKLP